ncbi:MAG: 50S ribosomal protein L22 [Planctomycetota bacterium]
MRLAANKLKSRIAESGVSIDDLAEAIDRTGLSGENAKKAIRNWRDGRDQPKAKASDIAKLASALGCEVKDLVMFVSEVRHHRGSPMKARLVADLVRGKSFAEAETLLSFSQKRAATNVRKALMAAYAEAEQAGAGDPSNLVVAKCTVDGASHIKRFQPKDRGRAHPILKRTSHITIGLSEIDGGGA